MLQKHKHIALHRRVRGPIKISDNEELGTDASCGKYDTMPTPEVSRVQEALKSSSLELQAMVTDPLPDALLRAEAVVSDMARENQNHELSVEKQNNADKDVLNPSVNTSVEPVQANKDNHRNQSCSHQNNAPKPSLMERNSTAQTYEVCLCALVYAFCQFILAIAFCHAMMRVFILSAFICFLVEFIWFKLILFLCKHMVILELC